MTCSVEECDAPVKARGLCGRCYARTWARAARAANPEKFKAKRREAYAQNPEKSKAASARYYAAHREEMIEKAKRYQTANPHVHRSSLNRRRAEKRVEAAGRPQAERCEICHKPARTCFDHCHTTGQFRGWICNECNLALGYADDDPARLRQMADYLDRFYHSTATR